MISKEKIIELKKEIEFDYQRENEWIYVKIQSLLEIVSKIYYETQSNNKGKRYFENQRNMVLNLLKEKNTDFKTIKEYKKINSYANIKKHDYEEEVNFEQLLIKRFLLSYNILLGKIFIENSEKYIIDITNTNQNIKSNKRYYIKELNSKENKPIEVKKEANYKTEKYIDAEKIENDYKFSRSITIDDSKKNYQIKEKNQLDDGRGMYTGMYVVLVIIVLIFILALNSTSSSNEVEKKVANKSVYNNEKTTNYIQFYGEGEVLYNRTNVVGKKIKVYTNSLNDSIIIKADKGWKIQNVSVSGKELKGEFFQVVFKNKKIQFFQMYNDNANIKNIQNIMNLFLDKKLVVDGSLGPKTKKTINSLVNITIENIENGIDIYEYKRIINLLTENYNVFNDKNTVAINADKIQIEIIFIPNTYIARVKFIQEELNKIGGKLKIDGKLGPNSRDFINKEFPELNIKLIDGMNSDEYIQLIRLIKTGN